MKNTITLSLLILIILSAGCSKPQLNNPVKPRTIVTTDGEVDDMDSFIRLLLYANDMDIEGLIYSSSQWHYAGDGKGTLFISEMPSTAKRYGELTDLRWPGTTWMQDFIAKYTQVYDNLIMHDPSYPSPDYLLSVVKTGNIEFEGEMEKVTEGSEHIKNILLDNEPGPVYVQIWGGTNTLARALKSIEEEYKGTPLWEEIYKKVSDKTFIYTILDQDATYNKYVAPFWPDIKLIYNSAQFWSFAYQWTRVVPDNLKVYMDGKWHAENIKFNHGPLMASYFTWGDGQKIEGDPEHTQGDTAQLKARNRQQYDFISEGDSPAYLYLLNWGLRSIECPSYGGIGGRFILSDAVPGRWEDGKLVTDLNPATGQQETSYPQVRWIDVLQNDFAARADWCVMSYGEANHAPVVTLANRADITAKAGNKVSLKGSAADPDGDAVSLKWWQYEEAGSYKGMVEIQTLIRKRINNSTEVAKPGDTYILY
jgi:hypothetical protein